MRCQVCSSEMVAGRLDQTFRCGKCGYQRSLLPVQINEIDTIDETTRENALYPLRLTQFRQVLEELDGRLKLGATLLDVGCAHGWFLTYARSKGFICSGVEPDNAMCEFMAASGIDHIRGFFPSDLPDGAKYDAIFFNDVFEHLSDIHSAAAAIHDRLNDDGLLVICLPMSNGLFFQIAQGLAALGITAPLSRLWQRGLPSPHLSYFSRRNLPLFIEQHGFASELANDLPSITVSGLFDRISYDSRTSKPMIIALWLGVLSVSFAARWFPSDARYFVFRKKQSRL